MGIGLATHAPGEIRRMYVGCGRIGPLAAAMLLPAFPTYLLRHLYRNKAGTSNDTFPTLSSILNCDRPEWFSRTSLLMANMGWVSSSGENCKDVGVQGPGFSSDSEYCWDTATTETPLPVSHPQSCLPRPYFPHLQP